MKRKGGRLEDWYFSGSSISGDIFDDDQWDDGEHIRTSRIDKFDREAGIVETRNTTYTLGEPQ